MARFVLPAWRFAWIAMAATSYRSKPCIESLTPEMVLMGSSALPLRHMEEFNEKYNHFVAEVQTRALQTSAA